MPAAASTKRCEQLGTLPFVFKRWEFPPRIHFWKPPRAIHGEGSSLEGRRDPAREEPSVCMDFGMDSLDLKSWNHLPC